MATGLSDRRSPAAPDVPTIAEAGGPPLFVTTWRGVLAPKGTSFDVIAKINRAVKAALFRTFNGGRRLWAGNSLIGLRHRVTSLDVSANACYRNVFNRVVRWWSLVGGSLGRRVNCGVECIPGIRSGWHESRMSLYGPKANCCEARSYTALVR
jgi:hypothetical protein